MRLSATTWNTLQLISFYYAIGLRSFVFEWPPSTTNAKPADPA